MPTTVLMVDEELGFLLWLGAVLGEAGYRAVPGKTVTDAARMARVFPPNVLVINPELQGAVNLIAALRVHNPALKVIALAEPEQGLEGVFVVAHKPTEVTDETARAWLRMVEDVAAGKRPKARPADTPETEH